MHLRSRTLLLPLAALVLVACAGTQDDRRPEPQESKFLRLLATDASTPNVHVLDPREGTLATLQGPGTGLSIYPTASGRHAAVIARTANLVRFYDSGIEPHGDHADLLHAGRWAATTATAPLPTHFFSSGDRWVVFNDGDGSLSTGLESQLGTVAQPGSLAVGAAHHGAVVTFSNGLIAVSHKDGTVAGTLPERVKLLHPDGRLHSLGSLATAGIHGDACDGATALFGAPEGVLKVTPDGQQALIPYPAGFGTAWIGTLHHGRAAKVFTGTASGKGLFRIDPQASRITPLLETATLASVAWDMAGRHLVALEADGTLHRIDPADGKRTHTKLALTFPAKGAPGLAASARFIYVADPQKQQIQVLHADSLKPARTLPVNGGAPLKLVLLGMDTNTGGQH